MNYLELIGTLVGLVYLWLEYRASIYLWIASIVMPVIYIVVYYQAGLYADLGINVYYVIASIYGLVSWTWKDSKKTEVSNEKVQISLAPCRLYFPLFLVSLLLTIGMAQLLIHLTDSTVPWADSFTTALSIIAMWMLAKKYAEQWLVWMVVDIVCSILYVYKELYFTAGLYTLYTLIAYLGYLKWKRMIKEQNI